jgi:hypothetical protein
VVEEQPIDTKVLNKTVEPVATTGGWEWIVNEWRAWSIPTMDLNSVLLKVTGWLVKVE